MPKHTAYYNEAPVDQSDYPSLAEKFKISYEIVNRCVESLQETGEVPVMAFSGTIRERVRALSEALSTNPPEVTQDEPEVFYDAKDEEAENIEVLKPVDQESDDFELEINLRDEIVDHAATALMQSFTDPEGCFVINIDGCCSINPNNPPTIETGYQAVNHILKLKELGDVVEDKSSWMLGSAIAALEDLFGEDFNVSQICAENELNYNTTYQSVNVFKAFPKRFKLSFSHHQEAYFAKMNKDPEANKESRDLVLGKAETYKLGAKQVRALCSIVKSMDGDDQVIKNIRSTQQANDLIAAYKAAKAQFVVFDEGVWITFTDAVDAVHEGKIVLNLKNNTATANNIVTEIKKSRPEKSIQ
jgi:hypothetical protein